MKSVTKTEPHNYLLLERVQCEPVIQTPEGRRRQGFVFSTPIKMTPR